MSQIKNTPAPRPPQTIAKVSPGWHGHLHLEFSDGSMLTVTRGNHEQHDPKPGDVWPPMGATENGHA